MLGYFFLYTIMPHAWSCSNQSSTNKIVSYPCTSKRWKFKDFVAINRKILPKAKNIFLCSGQIEGNSFGGIAWRIWKYVRQKIKLLIGNFTKTLYQHYFRIRPKQTSGKVLIIERKGTRYSNFARTGDVNQYFCLYSNWHSNFYLSATQIYM